MRTHILTALMALVLSACASHHRDVASVDKDAPAMEDTSGRTEHAVLDAVGSRGDRDTR